MLSLNRLRSREIVNRYTLIKAITAKVLFSNFSHALEAFRQVCMQEESSPVA